MFLPSAQILSAQRPTRSFGGSPTYVSSFPPGFQQRSYNNNAPSQQRSYNNNAPSRFQQQQQPFFKKPPV